MKTNLEKPIFLDLQLRIDKKADDEVFVQLPFNEKYYISNYGRVYSVYRGKVLESQLYGTKKIDNDYRCYKLKDEYGVFKNYKACKLVASVFVENPEPLKKTLVHHKNNNRHDDYYKNLQWVSQDEHKFLHTGRKVYYYNVSNGKLTNFTTINDMCDYLNVDRQLMRNAIYYTKSRFKLDNNTNVHMVKDKTYNGLPIYIAVEDEIVKDEPIKITVAEGILWGATIVGIVWAGIKGAIQNIRSNGR